MKRDTFRNKELGEIKELTIDRNCIESFRCWLIKTDIRDENGARPSWNSLIYDIQYSLEAWLKKIK